MPILDSHSMEFISRSPEQTRRAGMRLGALLQPGDLVCLIGDLGAGKTTLVQGLAAGWGSLDPVSSPTFVIVNVYRRRETERRGPAYPRPDARRPLPGQPAALVKGRELYHLDAYRLSGPAEAQDLDLEELLENGPLVIEWADRIETILPAERLRITLQYVDPTQRDLVISAHGERYQKLLAAFRRQVYGVA
jgi:tRNA threonylcarbamoyladenosine biosynthesis protein TsaE